jgi:hypothetical protein
MICWEARREYHEYGTRHITSVNMVLESCASDSPLPQQPHHDQLSDDARAEPRLTSKRDYQPTKGDAGASCLPEFFPHRRDRNGKMYDTYNQEIYNGRRRPSFYERQGTARKRSVEYHQVIRLHDSSTRGRSLFSQDCFCRSSDRLEAPSFRRERPNTRDAIVLLDTLSGPSTTGSPQREGKSEVIWCVVENRKHDGIPRIYSSALAPKFSLDIARRA